MNKKGLGAVEAIVRIVLSGFFLWIVLIMVGGGFSLGISLTEMSPVGWGVIIALGLIVITKIKGGGK